MKTEIIHFNKKYNIIKIFRTDIIEFYIEKINYGNLWYLYGVQYDMKLPNAVILEGIEIAEYNKFWGEE